MDEKKNWSAIFNRACALQQESEKEQENARSHATRAGAGAALFMLGLLFSTDNRSDVRWPGEGAAVLAVFLTLSEINERRKSMQTKEKLDAELKPLSEFLDQEK
jgi:hypothetical protein